MIVVQTKQPGETLTLTPPFAAGEPMLELIRTAAVARGLVPGSTPLTVLGHVRAGIVTVSAAGGTDGERYLVTVEATTATAQLLEAELEVVVIDGAWQLPDGGAPYLSIAAFVEAVGLDEVLAMTDVDGSGRVNRGLIVGALTAAQAIADAHLAARYPVPLATVPAIVELAIADIARARLYPKGAPDGVATANREALDTLKRISTGALPLGVATPPPAAPSETPILISPGWRAYPDGLQDY